MSIAQAMLAEFEIQAPITRRFLERLPQVGIEAPLPRRIPLLALPLIEHGNAHGRPAKR